MNMRKVAFFTVIVYLAFFSLHVFADDPGAPFSPDDNIQDPGDPSTPGTGGTGCGPTDPNCYVTVTSMEGPITIVNGNSLFSTGLTDTGLNSDATSSIFLGDNAGNGATNANNSVFLGDSAGQDATLADNSIFLGAQAGYGATNAHSSIFLGTNAGLGALNATGSNLIGEGAGLNASGAIGVNFFGPSAGEGATDAVDSNFFGNGSGQSSTDAVQSNFFGASAGADAPNAENSNFFGYRAGQGAEDAANSIFIGENAGYSDTVDNTGGGYSILFGPDTHTGNFSNSIAVGRGATNTASNQLIFGSSTANSYISNIFFGSGVTASSPVATIINGSGASGADTVGASLALAGGKATGNAVGGALIFQTSDAGVSGATLQSLSTKAILLASGNFGIGDTTPSALFTVGNGDLFKVNSSGAITSATGITSSGTITLSGFSSDGGPLYTNGSGVLSQATAGTSSQILHGGTTPSFGSLVAGDVTADALDFTEFQDTLDLDAALTLNQGTNTWTQNYTGTASTGLSYVADSLTSGRALSISSSSLTFGSLVQLSVASTGANANLQKVLNVSTSGANTAGNQTTYGGFFSNTHTGPGISQNRAVYGSSSGANTNTGVYGIGSGGTTAIGLYATASGGTNNYAVDSDGPLLLKTILFQDLTGESLSIGAGATQVGSLRSMFFGSSAGVSATNADDSLFLGLSAGDTATNASDSNFFGAGAGYHATDASDSNFLGYSSGYQASSASFSNFSGYESGYQATSASKSNFLGYRAGKLASSASFANFFGANAGENATNANDSVFIGSSTGSGATDSFSSVFIGSSAGQNAVGAEYSVFIGAGAGSASIGFDASSSIFIGLGTGYDATNADNSIFMGEQAGYQDAVDNSTGGYSILLGPFTDTGNFSNSIAMGRGATNTASNQLIFGSDDANSYISSVFFGTGVTATSPQGVVINGSGAFGADTAGASLTFAGGKATGSATGGSIIFQTSDAGGGGSTLQSLTTKATLLASGNFGLGDTTPDYLLDLETNVASYTASFFNDGNATTRSGILIQGGLDDNTAAGPSTLIGFKDGDGTDVGSISFGSSATAYNTTSDQRLKTTVNDRTGSSLDLLNQIQIHDFTWKNDPNNNLYTGVYAQELYDVYPHAVTKPVNDSDNWMVDYSKLTPIVIASIQDLDIKLQDISDFENDGNSFGDKLRAWFGSSTNGIRSLFVKDTVCIGETCINEEQLKALIQNSNINPSVATPSDVVNTDDNSGDAQIITEEGDTTDTTPDVPAVDEGAPETPQVETPPVETTPDTSIPTNN